MRRRLKAACQWVSERTELTNPVLVVELKFASELASYGLPQNAPPIELAEHTARQILCLPHN